MISQMKTYLYLLFAFSCLSANAQTRRFEFSAGIGNNGQIQEVLDDYFYISNPLYILDESADAEASKFKYNITGKIFFNEHLSLRLRYGNSKTHNSYVYNSNGLNGDFWNKQTVTNFNPALSFHKNFDKLNISTGIELAFYQVKEFISYFEGKDIVLVTNLGNQYYVQRSIQSETKVEGGKGTAVNGFLEVGYSFNKRLGVGITMSYGYLWAKFGDEIVQSDDYLYSGNQNLNLPRSTVDYSYKKYKKKSFAPPEISVFLSLRLGKILGDSKPL